MSWATSSLGKGTKNPQYEVPLVEGKPPHVTNLMAMDGDTSLPTCFASLQPTSSPMTRSRTILVASLSTCTLLSLYSSVSFICIAQQLHVAYASIPIFSTFLLTCPLDHPSTIFSTTPPFVTRADSITSPEPSTTSQLSHPYNLRPRGIHPPWTIYIRSIFPPY